MTLLYTWRPDYAGPKADLLAAQSLIYNKVVIQKDEILAVQLSCSLDFGQCARLYEKIRFLPTPEVGEKAIGWLRSSVQH